MAPLIYIPKDIYSAFVYLNNQCYYFDRKTSYIKKYNPKTNKSANVFNVESVKENIDVVYSKKDSSNKLCNMKWYDYSNSNLIYNRKYVYLAVVDNCMFFNTNSQIYQVDIKNKKAVKVFTVPKNEIGQNKGWLYGIAFNNNKLYYQVKKSMGSQFVGINKEVKGSYVTYKETSTQKEENDENSLSKASVILSKTVFTYDGKACTPSVKVSMNNKQLTVNKDYKVTYTSNNTIGRAYVNVTGIGDYTGTKSVGFNIYMPTASHLTSYANTSNSISIKWSSVKGITGYEIYRCDSQIKIIN